MSGAGGEILKFMGDGMLAMFPIVSPAERRRIAARAVQAATTAERAMTELNHTRAEAGESAVRFGLALHIGEVNFGNIGASSRLDFTVVGPAVNYAARLEKLCATLGRPVIVSAAVADLVPEGDVTPLDRHVLEDIDTPQMVYGLAFQ